MENKPCTEIDTFAPRVIQVIKSYERRGEGIVNDPIRRVVMFHTLDGVFLAENDPCAVR